MCESTTIWKKTCRNYVLNNFRRIRWRYFQRFSIEIPDGNPGKMSDRISLVSSKGISVGLFEEILKMIPEVGVFIIWTSGESFEGIPGRFHEGFLWGISEKLSEENSERISGKNPEGIAKGFPAKITKGNSEETGKFPKKPLDELLEELLLLQVFP